jgi:hypothetical protein
MLLRQSGHSSKQAGSLIKKPFTLHVICVEELRQALRSARLAFDLDLLMVYLCGGCRAPPHDRRDLGARGQGARGSQPSMSMDRFDI